MDDQRVGRPVIERFLALHSQQLSEAPIRKAVGAATTTPILGLHLCVATGPLEIGLTAGLPSEVLVRFSEHHSMWRGQFCSSRQLALTVSSISALLSREIPLTIAIC